MLVCGPQVPPCRPVLGCTSPQQPSATGSYSSELTLIILDFLVEGNSYKQIGLLKGASVSGSALAEFCTGKSFELEVTQPILSWACAEAVRSKLKNGEIAPA